jgi:hypothetical protein
MLQHFFLVPMLQRGNAYQENKTGTLNNQQEIINKKSM